MWCELCGVSYVVPSMWCDLWGVIYVVQSTWCSLSGEIHLWNLKSSSPMLAQTSPPTHPQLVRQNSLGHACNYPAKLPSKSQRARWHAGRDRAEHCERAMAETTQTPAMTTTVAMTMAMPTTMAMTMPTTMTTVGFRKCARRLF